jgi:serine phosphatase RsbU (regulator of sigma subunit)
MLVGAGKAKAQGDFLGMFFAKEKEEIQKTHKLAASGDSAAFFQYAAAYRKKAIAKKNYELLCVILEKYAVYYYFTRRPMISLKYFDTIQNIIETRKLPDYMYYTLCRNRGVIYYTTGDFAHALPDYKRIEEVMIKYKVGDMAALYNNYAMMYSTAHDAVNAKKYSYKALPFVKVAKDTLGYIKVLKTLASVYYIEKNFYRSDSVTLAIVDLCKGKSHYKTDYAETLYEYTNSLKNQGRHEDTKPIFEELVKLTKELKDDDWRLQCTWELAKVNVSVNDLAAARKAANEAEKIHPSAAMPVLEQEDVYGNAAVVYQALGLYEKATKAYSKYKEAAEEWHNKNDFAKLGELSRDYEKKQDSINLAREKKIMELNNLREEEKAENKLQQQRTIIIISLLGIIVIIGFSLSLVRANRNKEKANKEISYQKGLLAEKNKEITDSIIYAQRIQQSLLPPVDVMEILLPRHFLVYMPKDIVSGDFYWTKKLNANELFIAVADCTGHGVPGAMMSALSIQNLNELSGQTRSPGQLLSLLNNSLRNTLQQDQEGFSKDGLDICLCKVNIKERKIQYSGANRSLLVFDEKGLKLEIKATKYGIGGHTAATQVYEEHELSVDENDMIVMSTDGFADQFGGKDGRKLTTKRFKDWMTKIISVSDKKQELVRKFAVWKGMNEQIDDVCVLGFKI